MIGAIKTVGVLGLGVMGFDIAFLYAEKGYRTLLFDASKAATDKIFERRDQTIERLKKRNRISDAELKNLQLGLIAAPDLANLAGADLVTEAVSDSGKRKTAAWRAKTSIFKDGRANPWVSDYLAGRADARH
ncbi:MAG TPA: 3-hydroxyacyl-CoA dehydrogenase NAD-binding domain-containing protein [Verrucomicrobiae bacterium]|nr:3-hydroxyacyl-CoA dehydrogenase NAD-binding domain-containing protein [Verrucomicrobiae bacterium]